MSETFMDYLTREHARLADEIERENRETHPDQVLLARLKKLKLAVKDEIVSRERGRQNNEAA